MQLFLQSSITRNKKIPCEIKVSVIKANSTELSEGSIKAWYTDPISGGEFTEIVDRGKLFALERHALKAAKEELCKIQSVLQRYIEGEKNGSMDES